MTLTVNGVFALSFGILIDIIKYCYFAEVSLDFKWSTSRKLVPLQADIMWCGMVLTFDSFCIESLYIYQFYGGRKGPINPLHCVCGFLNYSSLAEYHPYNSLLRLLHYILVKARNIPLSQYHTIGKIVPVLISPVWSDLVLTAYWVFFTLNISKFMDLIWRKRDYDFIIASMVSKTLCSCVVKCSTPVRVVLLSAVVMYLQVLEDYALRHCLFIDFYDVREGQIRLLHYI